MRSLSFRLRWDPQPDLDRLCRAMSLLLPLLLVLLLLPAVPVRAATPPGRPLDAEPARASFLDSLEVRGEDIAPFRKWREAIARSAAETQASVDGDCGTEARRTCPYRDWLRFLAGLRGAERHTQLLAVNREINRRRYVGDLASYGREDYWASVGEFLLRDAGDCEDYAIAKFVSLKRLGWSDRALRLVAVRDLQLGIGHAVLIAFDGGRTWLLDNQIGAVTEAQQVHHYQPVYSINESAWWRHQPREHASTARSDGAAAASVVPADGETAR